MTDLSKLEGDLAWLGETEITLRQILDNSTTVRVFAKDLEGRYLFVNRAFEQHVGRPQHEIIGRTTADIAPPGVAERLRANDRRVIETGRALEVEETNVIRGERRTMLANKFPLLGPDGRPYAVCGISIDITERKRFAEALHQAAVALSIAGGDRVFEELARALAEALGVDAVMIAVFADEGRSRMRTLATCLDGRILRRFDYELSRTPCAGVVGREFRFVGQGVRPEFAPGTMFEALGFDSYAAYALNDAAGVQLGLIAALDRGAMVDRELAESLLKIFAGRAAAELERARAEQALRHSESSYRSIFEASEDPIFVHDWDTGAILDVSPKAAEVYGYSREEMRRLTVADVSANEPAYALAELARHIQQAKVRAAPVRFEWHAQHRDGGLMWHEVTLKRATIAGEPRILAFTRDITERKLADEALRASEEQYRAVFNATADGLVLRDADNCIVDVNPALLAMTGHAREELVGTQRWAFIPPELHGQGSEFHRRIIAGEPIQFETVGVRKDGTRFDVEVRCVPIQYRGRPHVLAMAREITARRLADEALRASAAQYRAIFNATADALVLRDADFRIVDVNPAYEAMSGFTRDEVLGADRVVAHPERVNGQLIALHRRALAGEAIHLETEGLRKDGARTDIELRGVPIDHQGRPHVLYIGRDITARKRAEAERLALESQLRQAQKMEAIGQLTGGIAHDFNNILTSIMGYVALAAERDAAREDRKVGSYLEQAMLSSRRARDLIQQMLTFSRGQRGERRPVDLRRVAAESARLLRSSMPATLELETVADGEVPLAALDRVQAEQVLLNLCINARDALGGQGKVRVRVGRSAGAHGATCASCRQRIAGEFVELAVADDGPGIAPEVLERMFEPFFSTKEVGKGSGMGLATVHGIVHEHGGHLIVETGLGRGAAFRALFPVLRADDDAIEHETLPGYSPAARKARLRGRVLLVDDEEMVVGFMRELLEGWGLEVTAKRAAPDARLVFAEESDRYDLVITDQTMPRMTGLELARELVAIRPRLPVILYTGYADGVNDAQVEAAGVRAVLQKPIEPAQLLALLRAHLPREREAGR